MTALPSGRKLFWVLFTFEAAILTWLNWNAEAMTGLLPYYDDFARIIGSGFDPAAGLRGSSTFPMWGYGWLILVLRNKLTIVVFQQALAMFAVWATLRIIRRQQLVTIRSQSAMELLLLASPAWFALHSVLWPNSIAASLLPLSLLLMIFAVGAESSMRLVLVSGLLFGVLLNFRSDYLFLPVPAAVVIALFDGFRPRTMRRVAAWIVCIYVMLFPWAAYTHKATGHFLLTSTNGGHVFFIGLGNLPGNKWAIRPDDGDPVMHRLLERKFGKPAPSSLNYGSDVFLKQEFLSRVKGDPREFLRKMAYSGKSMVFKGAYPGEFYESTECKPTCAAQIRANGLDLMRHPLEAYSASPPAAMRLVLSLGADVLSRVLVALSYLLMPFTIWMAVRRRSLLAALTSIAILYQSALSMLGYYMQAYSSNIYLFYIINVVMGGSVLWRRLSLISFQSPRISE